MEKYNPLKQLREDLKLGDDLDISTLPLEDRIRVAEDFYLKYNGEYKGEVGQHILTVRLALCGLDALADCIDGGAIPANLFSQDHPEKVAKSFRALHDSFVENERRKSAKG